MSKELKAFNRIMGTYGTTNSLEGTYDDFLAIKKALQRLETIDNSKPSEALEYLETFLREMKDVEQCPSNYFEAIYWKYKNTFETIIKQTLQKAQEQEKVLKGLEVIKSKPFESASAINYIKINKGNPKMLDYEHYCMSIKPALRVNEEEFELLKEVC